MLCKLRFHIWNLECVLLYIIIKYIKLNNIKATTQMLLLGDCSAYDELAEAFLNVTSMMFELKVFFFSWLISLRQT